MSTIRQHSLRDGYVMHWPRADRDPRQRRAKQDLSPFVRQFSVNKSLAQPVGQFSLSLLPVTARRLERRAAPGRLDIPTDLYGSIRPGDMIMIGHDVPGGIMLGFVTKVSRSVAQGPQTQSMIQVAGADFGQLLVQDAIVHPSPELLDTPRMIQQLARVVGPDNPMLEYFKGLWGPDGGPDGREAPAFIAASLEDVVDFVFKAAVSMRLPYAPIGAAFGGSVPGDFVTTNVTTIGDAQVFNEGLNSYQGNIWGLLQNVIDPDFYEIYFQTTPTRIPGFPGGARWEAVPRVELVVRPKPFDEPGLQWESTTPLDVDWPSLRPALAPDLQAWEISRDMDHGHEFGRSSANVYSYYQVVSRHDLLGNDQAFNLGLHYPLIDTFQLTRYGLRPYTSKVQLVGNQYMRTKAFQDLPKGERTARFSDAREEIHEQRGRLFNWYRITDYFENGTISVPGNDLYRPGDPVEIPWLPSWLGAQSEVQHSAMRFYCTAVAWNWQHGGTYTSQLELVRGHNNVLIEAAKAEIARDKNELNPANHVSV